MENRPIVDTAAGGGPSLSVVIPMYNAAPTIGRCLDSVFAAAPGDLQVIVVDDNSSDGSGRIAARYPCELISVRTPRNIGPGAARNRGGRAARGEVIVFVDADIVLTADTLRNIRAAFTTSPDLEVLGGIYAKEPANVGFGAWFVALKTFYFASRGAWRKPITFVQSACCGMRRALFEESGGFSEKGAAEEYEYGRRLKKKHEIYMDKSVVVVHHHPAVLARLEEITRRTYHWFPLFLGDFTFETDGGTGTRQEGLSALLYFTSFVLLLLCLARAALGAPPPAALVAACLLPLAAAVAVNAGLYRFMARERSWLFALAAVPTDALLYVGVGCGASAATAAVAWRAAARQFRGL